MLTKTETTIPHEKCHEFKIKVNKYNKLAKKIKLDFSLIESDIDILAKKIPVVKVISGESDLDESAKTLEEIQRLRTLVLSRKIALGKARIILLELWTKGIDFLSGQDEYSKLRNEELRNSNARKLLRIVYYKKIKVEAFLGLIEDISWNLHHSQLSLDCQLSIYKEGCWQAKRGLE